MKRKTLIILILMFMLISFLVLKSEPSKKSEIIWGVVLPHPKNVNTLIKYYGIDPTVFEITNYDKNDIDIIKNEFEKIDINYLNQIYEHEIYPNFINRIKEEDQEVFFRNFNKEELFNTENYYLFRSKNRGSLSPDIMLMILDVQNLCVYTLISYS